MSEPRSRRVLHAIAVFGGVGAWLAYLFAGGGHLDGRLVAAVLGDNWWVQGVAGWLWAFITITLVYRGDRGDLGSGRKRLAAFWVAAVMAFFAFTIVPIGKGAATAGEASAALGGAAEAPGFALGLMVAVPTIALGKWLLNWDKRKQQKLEWAEIRRIGADLHTYGLRVNGHLTLHPEWLRPTDTPFYARVIREEHLGALEDLDDDEVEYLETKLQEAGRAPDGFTPRARRPRGRRRAPRPS